MKNTFKGFAIGSMIMFGAATSANASEVATGGTINFYGLVTDTSCSVSVNGQGSDADVYLSPINKSDFKDSNSVYKQQPFNITISNCQAAEGDLEDTRPLNLSISFVGGNLADFDTQLLANTLPSGSTNVFYVLTTNTNKPIDIGLGDQAKSEPIELNGALQFDYKVGYVAKDITKVTVGQISSYVTYQIKYD